ncbi:hypothetical protein [Paenibacillus abyssi]|nr:hypothetical protein [Paenibacillus abyssi]
MNALRKGPYLLALWLAVFMFSVLPANAEPAIKTETLRLDEKQFNVQFIVTGEASEPFEVELEMPGGTRYTHDQFDGKKVLYLDMEGERRWLINEAPAGEYKLHISGTEQAYRVTIKKELRRPDTAWVSPLGTELTAANEPIQLAWRSQGDYDANDRIRFFLRPAGGWQNMLIGEAQLGDGAASLYLPGTLADGEYELFIIADNKTPDGQHIEPDVTLHVQRGVSYDGIRAVHAIPRGDAIELEFEFPRDLEWTVITASFTDGTGSTFLKHAGRQELSEIEQTERTDMQVLRWLLPLNAGAYKGSFQVVFGDYTMSPVMDIPSFELKMRDWSKDEVKWSIETEKTNARQLQVILKLQAKTHVQIVNGSSGILFDQAVAGGEEAEEQIVSVPLAEGDQIIEVLLADQGGAVKLYSKRYLVDYTPPRLTMIQPLSTHERLEGGLASGFADLDSIIIHNGNEITPDASGYFSIEGVGDSLEISVRDSHGNETSYSWQAAGGGWSKALIVIIVINLLLVGGTVTVILIIRKKNLKQP